MRDELVKVPTIKFLMNKNPNQLITLYEVTNKMREMKNLKSLKVNNDIARIAAINLYEATDKETADGCKFISRQVKM